MLASHEKQAAVGLFVFQDENISKLRAESRVGIWISMRIVVVSSITDEWLASEWDLLLISDQIGLNSRFQTC